MRLYEFAQFLLEYKREITQRTLGDKLVATAVRDGKQDIDTILNILEQTDPTKTKQYVEWLCRQYIAGQFRLEDYPHINDVLVKFENVKRRLEQKDINKYTFRSLGAEIDKIYNVELTSNDKDQSADQMPGVEVLYKGPLGVLASPETEEASKILGRGTKWCTSGDEDNMFGFYANGDDSDGGVLYVWKDKNGEKYQIYMPYTPNDHTAYQIKDSHNADIDDKTLEFFRTRHPVLSKLFAEEEHKILSGLYEDEYAPVAAFFYARDMLKHRWPAAEDMIKNDDYNDIWKEYAEEFGL